MSDLREIDDERVLIFGRSSGRGKASGAGDWRYGTEYRGVFHVRDGKVTKYVIYWDHTRALADLGLDPSSSA
jgi:ketosteroid isomerase-like protein